MRLEPSVHDNFIYAYSVDCEGRRLILHTRFHDDVPEEFTDVVFRDVVAHDFKHVLPGNILFDVDESDIATVVRENEQLFAGSSRYGWPPVEYRGDLGTLIEALKASSVRAYVVNSSYGLSGWVLAGSCERVSRTAAAKIL